MSSPTQKTVPTLLKPFSCSFEDIDTPEENLVVTWEEPQDDMTTITREERYRVGEKCLLDDQSDVNFVFDEQLEACVRMGSLLAGTGAGGVILGTAEFFDLWVAQDTKHLQTIVGTVRVDSVVSRADLGQEGILYDITFRRSSGQDRKTILTDVKTISDYKMGLKRYFFGAQCVPAWIEKEFPSFDKGNLDAAKRQQIIDALPNTAFWI